MPEHQRNQIPPHFQQRGNGPHKQDDQSAAAQERNQGQGHHRGLVGLLTLRGVLHPGVDQGAARLQGADDGHYAHPDRIGGQNAIAVGAQQPGKNGGSEDGQSPQEQGAEHIQESNAVLFFHNQVIGFR